MSEEKKRDILADALAALAAGEHHEEVPEGSGMESQIADEPAAPAPAPAPIAPKRPAPPAPRPGGPPQPIARTGAPTPKRVVPPTPAQASDRTPPTPAKPRSNAPAPKASGPAPIAPSRSAPPRVDAPMRPASPNSKVRPSTPDQAVPQSVSPQARSMPAAAPPPPAARPVAPPPPIAPPPPPVEEFVDPIVEPVIEEPAQPLSPEEQAAIHEAEVAAEAEAMTHIVEDDDTLNLPALPPEALAPRRAPRRPQRELASRTISFKQTMIPILLTMGVLLSGIAAWSFVLGEESPVVDAPFIPICVLALGILMLVFAVVTMLQVKAQLSRQTKEEAG